MIALLVYATIAGSVVAGNDPAHPAVRNDTSIVSLRRDFVSPAELTLTTTGWKPSIFAVEAAVRLYVGGVAVFDGLLMPPELPADDRGRAETLWRAVDRSAIPRSATSSSGATTFTIASKYLWQAVPELLAHIATPMAEMGISAPAYFDGGAANVVCLPVTFNNVTVAEAIRLLAAAAPGVGVYLFYDAALGTNRWRFVRGHGLPATNVVIEDSIIGDVRIETSLDGRAGAVMTNPRQASGVVSNWQTTATLNAAWDALVQTNSWTAEISDAHDSNGGAMPSYYVFRRFSYAHLGDVIGDGTKVKVLIQQSAAPTVTWVEEEVDEDQIDTANKTITLRYPAVHPRADVRTPGKATAGAVKLRYQNSNSGYVTVPGTRYPASGFSGKVTTIAPTLMAHVLNIEVPDGIDHAAYAQSAHAAYSEPLYRGEVSFKYSAIPGACYDMLGRFNFSSVKVGATGYESIAAPMTGFEVSFGGGGLMAVSLNSEKSPLVRRDG